MNDVVGRAAAFWTAGWATLPAAEASIGVRAVVARDVSIAIAMPALWLFMIVSCGDKGVEFLSTAEPH